MIFTETAPTEAFDVQRYVSESGRWELGLRRVLYGVRICANPVGDLMYVVDYCAGAGPQDIAFLFRLVRTILESLPESVSPAELEALLPRWTVRPIHRDRACLDELVRLACEAIRAPHPEAV